MSAVFNGAVNVDIRDSQPDWAPFEPPRAPDGAPSVVYIVLDDVGFSAMSCYGGPILQVNGFSSYIVSGGGRDFMRPISQDMYGVPRERVIGSSSTFTYTSNDHGGTITHKPEADYLDDGPEKPVRIWSRAGRRPLLAAGNSNGDVAMLEFTHHVDKPTLRLLVLHDDAEREFDYRSGAEHALERAEADGWTVVSVKNDWATVF